MTRTIAIVGGGCSGLLVAVQLFKNGFRGRVTIVEPLERLGAGLAYSTSFDEHLLNVPAAKMSAFAKEPTHFLDWLRERHWPGATGAEFAPRKWFGEYLYDVFRETIHPSHDFDHVRAEATSAGADADGAHLSLSNGTTVRTDENRSGGRY